MNKKTYKIIGIVATVIAVIGLISFVGGIPHRCELKQ